MTEILLFLISCRHGAGAGGAGGAAGGAGATGLSAFLASKPLNGAGAAAVGRAGRDAALGSEICSDPEPISNEL